MSPRKTGRLVLVGAVLTLVVTTTPPALARNTVDDSDPSKYTVKVPIDLIADDPSLAKRWKKAITDHWNNGPLLGRFKCAGRSVEFVPDIRVTPAGGKTRPDAHKVRIKLLAPGVDFISTVHPGPGGLNPTTHSFTGNWGSNEDNATIAHEFGHLVGLPDEYEWIPYEDRNNNGRRDPGERLLHDKNGNGKRDPGEPTRPKPGFEGSLMAEHDGKVDQGLVNEAMLKHGIVCEEVWKATWHEESGSFSGEGEGRLTVAADGSVSGKGTTTLSGPAGTLTYHTRITGTREEDAFHLTYTALPPSPYGGSVDFVAPIQGTTAQGNWVDATGLDTGTVRLECVSCVQANV